MSELMISRAFVKKLASNIRVTYGKEVKHTDAIELVAGSLGWKGDALMHMLKQAEAITEAAKPGARQAKVDDKFQNTELLKSFFHAVIHGKPEVADQYAPLVSEKSAWCRLALAFHLFAKAQGKGKHDGAVTNIENAERHLIKAFKLDVETVMFVAQIVGMEFTPNSDVSKVIFETNRQRDYTSTSGKFLRGDLMAWATRIAMDWGFLVSTEGGLVVNPNARFADRIFKFEDEREKRWLFKHDIHFWDYVVEGLEDTPEGRLFAKRLLSIRTPVIYAIGKMENSIQFKTYDSMPIGDAFNMFGAESLVNIARGVLDDSLERYDKKQNKIVADLLEDMTGISVENGESFDDFLRNPKSRSVIDCFHKHLMEKGWQIFSK